MIYPFNKLKIQYAYSLKEVLKYGLNELGYTYDYPKGDSTTFTRALFTHYGIAFPISTTIPTTYIDDTNLGLFNRVIERYWDEIVFVSDEEMENPLNILSYPDILYKTRRFLGKFIDLVLFTYEKYTTILKAYSDNRANLMDQLSKTISGNDTRRDNDTPQDSGTFDDDSHTSFISQGEIENNEYWDDAPLIDRLDKIEKLYQQTMKNWVNEFKDLFIEGGNIHEV